MTKIPILQIGNQAIERTVQRSYDDLGALRIEDPNHPDRIVVAAGVPWFMALFGRDSLMALPVDPSLALGTLQTLADLQGSKVDVVSEEDPGKILHEVRLGVSSGLALGGKSAYYGSVDATPLFVSVLGEVSRWGFAEETIASLLPHADRALEWVRDYGDRDGDGFVEYECLNDRGLFCGFSREHYDEPVPYPTACTPQAWAAATPIMLGKTLLRYDVHIARGDLWMDPVVPDWYGDVHISNAPVSDSRVTIDVSGSTASIKGPPDGIVFHRGTRPWTADPVDQAKQEPPHS